MYDIHPEYADLFMIHMLRLLRWVNLLPNIWMTALLCGCLRELFVGLNSALFILFYIYGVKLKLNRICDTFKLLFLICLKTC